MITLQQMKDLGWKNMPQANCNELNRCLKTYSITSIPSLRHFLSQCSHESRCGYYDKESGDGSRYENRKDLGNTQPGDGKLFRGAGYLQLTGRSNYFKFFESFKKNERDEEIMTKGCEYVASKYPWTSAGFWWKNNNMNSFCDQGATCEQVTKKVNGGLNGLQDRKDFYKVACDIWK
jgi:putative chitinase